MIDSKTIQHMARLARLALTDEETKMYGEQLSKVLQHFEEVSKISTDGIEPLVTPSEIKPFWREDQAHQEMTSEEVLANAPQKTGHLFTVPPVV